MLPKLSAAYSASFGTGIAEGYGDNLFEVKWESPDWEMIRNLQTNVYEFSTAKSYQQLKALTLALTDADGKLIPEKEFIEIASRINKEMGITHLRIERDTAIGSAQMASRWVQFKSEADKFPNLTYRTVGDGQVRPSHAAMDGTTLPITHSFWATNYPPNGWNCRCDVEQSINGAVTPENKIYTPEDTPPMFKTNMAETGVAFPEEHPYYDELPAGVMKAANGINPFIYTKIHKGKKGGYVYNNAISNANAAEIETAQILADNGHKVILLPELQPVGEAQQALRKICLPKDVPEGKNTDAMVNGKLVDFKNIVNTSSALDNAIRYGSKQAGIVCIRMVAFPYDAMSSVMKQRVKRTAEIKEVWIIAGTEIKKLKRADMLK
ncbi:hypothetical protein CAP35_13815 [Chitinophagaceae bacterium IBVUCB1]|nr:hypothetical protein CAP35_13815 [Chitinophagaceae bacterium IBVUCB1]